MQSLNDHVSVLPGISKKTSQLLARLGINNIRELITHFPRYHRDTSEITPVSSAITPGDYTLKVSVENLRNIRLKGNRSMQTAKLIDESGEIGATWFNQPFLTTAISASKQYLIRGKIKEFKGKLTFSPISYEAVVEGGEQIHLGRLTPQYALTQGLGLKNLRSKIKYVVDNVGNIEESKSWDQKTKQSIVDLHFPPSQEALEAAYHGMRKLELISLHTSIIKKRENQTKIPGISLKSDINILHELQKRLPFTLTEDQIQATTEALATLKEALPSQRLLQGDVGSGKTIVAVACALHTQRAGYQTVVLVPTTVLAEQHFSTFNTILKDFNLKICLVTGSTKTGEGEAADILIGTSAILARKTSIIRNLGLLIIDEQHRFGVRQREDLLKPLSLEETQPQPHLLSMTATPIPRTLALSLFDGISVSILSKKPAGRLPVSTRLIPEAKRKSAEEWIAAQIKLGQQAYWICPLVEEGEQAETRSVKALFNEMSSKTFPKLKLGLLHGKLNPKEKSAVLDKFIKGEIDILVSTSVVEVGIDVPNANIIVIEGAEHFGLAQLHQLRGRVGRGEQQSWCFLFQGETNTTSSERLAFFCNETDGFKVAEYDLAKRGPGEVYGLKQAGVPNLKIADFTDLGLVKSTKLEAEKLYEKQIPIPDLFYFS